MTALARWDTFLAQIEARHRQVRDDAERAARHYIAAVAAGGDDRPLSQQLSAACGRLADLEAMISDTWHAKVDDAIDEEGLGAAARDRAYARGEAVRWTLEDARDELEPRLLAELARQRYAHAAHGHRAVVCTACGATGEPPLAFRAVELACGCGARVVFEPGELMRSVAAVGSHALAQEAVAGEWRAMRAAERALHRIRPPRPLAAVKDVERSHLAYWFAYLAVRSRFEPELARDPVFEVRSRMQPWYESFAEHEEAWVQAGRPREQL